MKHTWFIIFLLSTSFLKGQFVSTIAGQLDVEGANNGAALTEATFTNPHGITADADGNIYIADRFGHRIRKYTQDGEVSTIAGNGIIGNADGNGISAFFNEPWGVCMGTDGYLYVADTRNNLIRRIDAEGNVSTFAGSGNYGGNDGFGINASFGNPTGLEMDAEGNLYVADHLTHVIRKIDPQGVVTTIAGVAGSAGYQDGTGSQARFYRPYGLTLDLDGNLIVADEWNHRIRKVTPQGQVTTIGGNGNVGYVEGFEDETEFNYPWDISVDEDGNLYVADGYNNVIRIMEPLGTTPESYETSLYAGNPGVSGGIDGFGGGATFNAATSIHYWPVEQTFFVADAYNNLIRRIDRFDRPALSAFLLDPDGNALDPEQTLVVCPGTPINVVSEPDTLNHYYFYIDGDEVQSSLDWTLEYQANTEDTLDIQVIATDDYGLLYSNNLQVIVQNLGIAGIQADQVEIDADDNQVQFSILGEVDSSLLYTWNFGDIAAGDNNFSSALNPTHIYSGVGTYTVSLTAEDGQGCTDTLIMPDYIDYQDKIADAILFVPDAFTPNGDGSNDLLFVRGISIADVDFSVYNQWGERVFESNSLDIGWDGTYKGQLASACTYTYLVVATTLSGEQITQSGHVSIIR